MSTSDATPQPDQNPAKLSAEAAVKLDKRRRVKDKVTNGLIAFGGIFVLLAICAIFFELMRVSLPLFTGNGADKAQDYQTAMVSPNTSMVQVDEYNQTGMRLIPGNQIQFFDIASGKPVQTDALPIPAGVDIVKAKRGSIIQNIIGFGLSDGSLLTIRPKMTAQGLGDERVVTTNIEYPFGTQPVKVGNGPLTVFDIQENDGELNLFANVDGQLRFQTYGTGEEEDGLSLGYGDSTTENVSLVSDVNVAGNANNITTLEIGQGARWLYAITKGGAVEVMRNNGGSISSHERVQVADKTSSITASNMLQGDISLLLGDNKGNVSQWFMVKSVNESGTDENTFTKIRDFKVMDAPITIIEPEVSRKGILAGDQKGNVGYFYTTSDKTIAIMNTGDKPVTALNMSSHGDGLLTSNTQGNGFWKMDAAHPEVSMSSIWGNVWYESYQKPDYVWQSSSGNVDFEPKMSLVPLTFGTLKAAFWAMILSAPLAIAGAMYTAVFMNPALRGKVKPALELMEALPTVILGFLAGLWLAPLVNQYLPSIFSLLIVVPIVILITGFLWMQMPLEKRNSLPAGIAPAVLIAPILIGGAIAFLLTDTIETKVFASHGGSMVEFLRASKENGGLGIDYQDQNALIVGLMMGFAVIPTIFSIAEDALFAVPRHLTNGSLALGATPWQTMTRVVLPTASPGIFSALMIGFGRAVGETMIVLMATGNTPIMDLSLFNGMRTLSANVAVEMGEAEVGSTHYRVLYLSALVLFVLTFFLNTMAEVVRSRLRKKYGSL